MKLKIKDQIPETEIFHLVDGEPQKVKLREILGTGKVILFGLPGAFTSTCSKFHLPGFIKNADRLKAKGIKNIFCLSANDPYVMNAWGEINKTANKQEVKNKKLWTELDLLNNEFEISWNWVKAHSTDELNNEVDLIAKDATNL